MGATIRVNGEDRRLEVGTVIELLRAEGVDPERRGVAVALNGANAAAWRSRSTVPWFGAGTGRRRPCRRGTRWKS